jgi:hypothetical protein
MHVHMSCDLSAGAVEWRTERRTEKSDGEKGKKMAGCKGGWVPCCETSGLLP